LSIVIFSILTILVLVNCHYFPTKTVSDAEMVDALLFWTEERIKNAKPLDIPVVNMAEPFNETFQDGGNTKPVPENQYRNQPYRTAGKLLFNTGSGTASCTASSIGNNAVLTAGHCIHPGNGNNYYTQVVFRPQHLDNTAPLGVWPAARLWTTNEWARGGGRAFSRDVGAVQVSSQNGRTVAQAIGGQSPTVFNQNGRLPTECIGYPGNFGNAQKMIHSVGNQADGHTNMSPPTLKVPSRMTFGASGGPWFVNNGANTNGCNSYIVTGGVSQFLYGPRFDNLIQQLLANAQP